MDLKKTVFLTLVFILSFSSVYAADKGANPVAHWRFDEGGGGIAYDESANNNDGTLVGNVKFIAGKIGKGIQLFGAGDWVTFGSGASLNIPTNITIEAWVDGYNMLISRGTQYGVFIDNSGGNRRVRYWYWGATSSAWVNYTTAYGTVPSSGWSHIAVVNIPGPSGFSRPKIYVNGVEQTVTGTPSPQENNSGSGGVVYLGEYAGYRPYNQFVGKVDDVRIYNYARTVDQILVDYNAGSAAHLGAGTDPNEGNPPVGYWPLDENTGTTAYDRSGNGRNGTVVNATWTQGKNGNALNLDGNGDYVELSSNPITTNTWTLEMWFNIRNSDQYDILYSGADNVDIQLFFHATTKYLTTSVENVEKTTSFDISKHYNEWHHVTWTHSGSNQTIVYIDGEIVLNTTDTTYTNSGETIDIGKVGGSSTYYIDGKIDDVKIYDYARTPGQVAYDYNKGRPVAQYKFDEGGGSIAHNEYSTANTGIAPVVWWRMDEGTGTSVSDQSGYGNTGTFGNTPAWVTGKIGPYAVSFDSTDDYVIKNPVSNFPTTEITAEFWIKTSDTGNKHPISYASSKSDNDFLLNDLGQGVLIGGTTCSTGVTYNDGNWHHVGITWKSSNGSIKVYKDGAQAYSGTHQQGYSLGTGGSFVLAQDQDSVGGGFDPAQAFLGQFDDVRIYNYVRTGEQIYNDYKTTQGTLVGNAKFADGKIGKALQFDGDGDYVIIDVDSWIRKCQYVTITGWYYHNADTGGAPWGIMTNTGSSAGDGFWWHINYPGNLLYLRTEDNVNGESDGTGTPFVSAGNWYYITTVIGTNIVKVYKDGVLYWSWAPNAGFSWANVNSDRVYFFIGKSYYEGSTGINGKIDEVKLYNYERTAGQILEDYAQGASRLGAQSAGVADPWSGALPVAHWKMDENTGVRAYDASGNGNNGTVSGAAWTQGKNGPALSFDGSDDYAMLSSTVNLGNTDWTVSAWMKTSSSARNTLLSNSSGGPVGNDLCINTSKIAYYHYDGVWQDEFGTSNVADGDWHFLTWANHSNQTMDLYVDGIRETTGAASALTSTGPVNQIGRNWYITANAKIDDVKIYNYARTQAQIAWDYNHGKPVAHYRFEEGSGTTAYDESDNNNDGTIAIGATGGQTTIGAAWTNGATGKFGKCMSFDGTDDYMEVNDSTSLDLGANPFAVEFWVNYKGSTAINQEKGFIGKTSSQQNTPGFLVEGSTYGRDGSTYTIISSITNSTWGAGKLESAGTIILNPNTWYHVATVRDGTTWNTYINGRFITSATQAGIGANVDNSNKLVIGDEYLGSGMKAQCYMDDVRIYNYARTAEQILQDYNNGAAARLGD